MSETNRPVIGGFYRHFKNRLYQVLQIAVHSETEEELVIYQALYGDFKVYARPLESFVSEVDHEKYPDATQKYRFVRVNLKRVVKPEHAEEEMEEELPKEDAQEESAVENMTDSAEPSGEEMPVDEMVKSLRGKDNETLLLEFLDARTPADKILILSEIEDHPDIHTLNAIAASMELGTAESEKEEELLDLIKVNLFAKKRYEITRTD